MFPDRVFTIAFILSLATHSALLLERPNPALTFKRPQNIEVRYLRNPPAYTQEQLNKLISRQPFSKNEGKITADRRTPPPFVDKDKLFSRTRQIDSREGLFTKPLLVKSEIFEMKKKISLPAVDLNKINNSSYVSYYQIVREKIRRAAYDNYIRTETGEVYLSFIISSRGETSDVRLVEEKSSPSKYLREIASKSIADAAPFPPFPKELDYAQLSFNVIISFEIE
jgi:TonB family protein